MTAFAGESFAAMGGPSGAFLLGTSDLSRCNGNALLAKATDLKKVEESVIVDTSGTTWGVEAVYYRSDEFPSSFFERHLNGSETSNTYNTYFFRIYSEPFVIVIPFKIIVSIENKGNIATVKYFWNGKQETLSGKFPEGTFVIASDFGKFELPWNKLRSFSNQEAQPYNEKEFSYDSTLVTTDGDRFSVANLGGIGKNFSSNSLTFAVNELKLEIEDSKIKTITFDPNGLMTVTIKNGKSKTGKPENLKRFAGFYEKEPFYIRIKDVKKVDFGEN